MSKFLYSKSEIDSIGFSFFTENQIKEIRKPTPESEIEIKTDRNGFKYKSVKASFIKRKLNLLFGWNYDFKIMSKEYIPSTKEVVVHGRLIIHNPSCKIIREQFGQHYLSTKVTNNGNKSVTHASDIGNGFKAAATDALKKCASEIGICWDIYGQEISEEKQKEIPALEHGDIKKLERLSHFLSSCNTTGDIDEVYDTYLQTAKETVESKEIYKTNIQRLLNEKEM